MKIEDLILLEQFSLTQPLKDEYLFKSVFELHMHHLKYNASYKQIITKVFNPSNGIQSLADLPFIPVSAFKNHELRSIPKEDVFKVLTSSGTTGQSLSKIYLDRETARLQTKALSKIISHIVGPKRLPMLIIDSMSTFKNRESFSARGAGILGIAPFGKDHTYILDENFNLNEDLLFQFLEKYNGQKIVIFGFTFMIWQFLLQPRFSKQFDLSNATLLHSGGWKKLEEMAIDNEAFKEKLKRKFELKDIFNYYGMVEQVGSVFMENPHGFLHAPNFADVIIRNPVDFSVQPIGEPGLIQVISPLPTSYPGHSLLTEDIGVLEGIDNSEIGWQGKYFTILGRAKKAELRGCSDTFNQ